MESLKQFRAIVENNLSNNISIIVETLTEQWRVMNGTVVPRTKSRATHPFWSKTLNQSITWFRQIAIKRCAKRYQGLSLRLADVSVILKKRSSISGSLTARSGFSRLSETSMQIKTLRQHRCLPEDGVFCE